MIYDIVIKNGVSVSGEPIEVAIKDGIIKKVAKEINTDTSNDTVDLEGKSIISAGWIDGHVHCFEKMELYYDFPDEIGINKGVTTIVDAGSTGAKNIGEFYGLAKQAKTNVFALVNISEWGILAQDELSDLSLIREELVREALEKYPDFVIGLKARMSASVIGNNGIVPLEMAKEIQHDNKNIPLMVHIGSAPPKLSDILSRLDKGDIVTHCFNGKENGILSEKDGIKDFVWEAYRKGVVFDIGHGTDSFNFHVAEVALKEKMSAATISTDIYHRNREDGPVHDLATTMEKLINVGYTLEEVIEKVTIKPAEFLHLDKKGHLIEGYDGDLTIFRVEKVNKTLTDSNGNTKVTDTCIIPEKAIIGGEIYYVG